MNFEWTADQLELRSRVVDFCARKLAQTSDSDADQPFSLDKWRACAEQGLAGLIAPREYGGSELDALTSTLLTEALASRCTDLGLSFSIAAHLYACVSAVAQFGSDAQKRRWLPDLAAGRTIASHAITESGAGSDIFSMRTVAERRGEDYVLNGSKCFTTNAPVAGLFLVQAVTRPQGGYFGMSAFLVPAGTPGLIVGKPSDKLGLRSSPMSDIYLENCCVHESHRLGQEGAGASVFLHSMRWERTCLFAIYLGAMQRQLEETAAWARQRKQFDRSIGSFQAVSHRIVNMKMRYEAARLLIYKAAWDFVHSPQDDTSACLAKLYVSEAAVANSIEAIQVHGGQGVMTGQIERYLRDAVPSMLFSGTSDIQRNQVARNLKLA